MTSDVSLDGLDLNDIDNFVGEQIDFRPAQLKPQFAESADADGSVLVREPHYTNAEFTLRIRVTRRATEAEAGGALGQLIDKLQHCARVQGGIPLEWTHFGTTYTWYAILGEIEQLPITSSGELAGWFIQTPVIRVKLTCRPFGYTPLGQVLSAQTSTDPLQEEYIGSIGGDVPAEAIAVVTDNESEDRRWLELGQDIVEEDPGASTLLLNLDNSKLTVTGYSGISTTEPGSYSTNIIERSLTSNPVTLFAAEGLDLVGSFRPKLRVKVARVDARFRVAYRVGDGIFSRPAAGLWIAPPAADTWVEIDLREIDLEAVEKGNQVSDIRIEGYSASGVSISYQADYVNLIPTRRYVKVRAPLVTEVAQDFAAWSGFSSESGAITGDTSDSGDTWTALADSDSTDFSVGSNEMTRSAVSDNGAMLTLQGISGYSGRAVGLDVNSSAASVLVDHSADVDGVKSGLLIVPPAKNQFLYVIYEHPGFVHFGYESASPVYAHTVALPISGAFSGRLSFVANGSVFRAFLNGELVGEEQMLGVTPPGYYSYIYDEHAGATACTRTYADFASWTPEDLAVCFAGRSAELRHDAIQRENAGGTAWGNPPVARGAHFLLDPAGDDDLVNRLAFTMRRNDIEEEPDSTLGDEQRIEVWARERFLAPR